MPALSKAETATHVCLFFALKILGAKIVEALIPARVIFLGNC